MKMNDEGSCLSGARSIESGHAHALNKHETVAAAGPDRM